MPKMQLKTKDKLGKMRNRGSIEIKNQSSESADLYFYGDIVNESWGAWKDYFPDDQAPTDVKEFLDQLDNVDHLNIYINSGGGSVFGGIAIYNLLKRHNSTKTVYVDAIAASIASVIAMAGDKIIIPSNAQMMIHKPSCYVGGNADDMRKEADILDRCQQTILSTYMEHVKDGVTEEQINDLINAETWKTGDQWQEYFDIEVSESNEAVASTSDYFDKYSNLPETLLSKTQIPQQPMQLDTSGIVDAVIAALDKREADRKAAEEAENEKLKNQLLEDNAKLKAKLSFFNPKN